MVASLTWAASALSATTVLVLAGVIQTVASAQKTSSATVPPVFDGVMVVDVEQGKLHPLQRVVVVGNRIHAVGNLATVSIPTRAQVVPAKHKDLTPDLWDMHTHSRRSTAIAYPLFLAYGATGIRDAASDVPLDTLILWQREVLAGSRVGPPRQLLSGPAIDGYAAADAPNKCSLVESIGAGGHQ